MSELEPIAANICLSGGAEGADLQWGCEAGKAGHAVIHWTFAGHRSRAPAQELVELSAEQLAVADEHLLKANETIKRRVPFDKPWIANLLRRNYYQVRDAEAVYAVGMLKDGEVQGGTSWATTMFSNLRKGTIYFFDQGAGKWLAKEEHNAWCDASPPPPRGIYAGVGSRQLSLDGKMAIRQVFLTNINEINS